VIYSFIHELYAAGLCEEAEKIEDLDGRIGSFKGILNVLKGRVLSTGKFLRDYSKDIPQARLVDIANNVPQTLNQIIG
jgi:hypothetical protein